MREILVNNLTQGNQLFKTRDAPITLLIYRVVVERRSILSETGYFITFAISQRSMYRRALRKD